MIGWYQVFLVFVFWVGFEVFVVQFGVGIVVMFEQCDGVVDFFLYCEWMLVFLVVVDSEV